MYPVTDRFLAALPRSHRVVTQVQLIQTDGQVIDLPHTGGSVPVDRGAAIRRTCTVTSADLSLIPTNPADELLVYGARLRVSRGIDYGDGTQELVPLGYFRLDEISGDVSTGPVTLAGVGLEAVLIDDRFTAPWRASGSVIVAITALILRSLPDAQILPLIDDVSIGPRTWDVEGDPWAAVQEIAAAAGAECYADASGTFVISTLPDASAVNPVWTVAAGEGGVYIKGTRGMSAAGVFNAVLARGDNTEAATGPVSYLVTDDNPGSPTYWGGPYGHRTAFYSSSTLTTEGACRAAAQLKLAALRAPNASGSFSSLPNPALEPGDVLRVIHPDGLSEIHQVQSFTVPLEVGGDFPITTIGAKEDA
ncbi:DUF5047 domain-containing protein [Streptomyces sp. NPDC052071]|uniref:DUF5047 domain-containing protein n=1 Tax=Streptomyces sp. NPDC052071 TaxID=3156666 RepID=UPI0034287CDD